jgi:S1-C subfamily serine protease
MTSIMKYILIILLVLYLPISLFALPSPKEIYQRNREAVCLVSFYQNIASDARIGSYDKIQRHRIGVLVNSSGLIMVSNDVYPASLDVVSNSGSLLSEIPTDFKVKLFNKKEYPAKFLGKDDQAQVAFIQLEDSTGKDDFPFVEFWTTENIGIGDSIYVLELLDSIHNFEPIFTPQIIHAVIESPRRKFLINNYTISLSAGGLVLNQTGKAIGVTIKQFLDFNFISPGDFEELHQDYLEIAPTEWFRTLINKPPNIEENLLSPKAWLGIRMQALSENLQKYWSVPQKGGIIINQIYPESPAEEANLAVGDIILAIADSTLLIEKDEETSKLRNIILSQSPGTTIEVKIFRKGKIEKKKIHLRPAPKSISLAQNFALPKLGFEIRELTRDIIYQENLPLYTPGVFVYQVDRASPAGIAGLEIGDIIQEINGQKVNSFKNAKKILQETEKNSTKKYMLKVLANRFTRFVFLDLNK